MCSDYLATIVVTDKRVAVRAECDAIDRATVMQGGARIQVQDGLSWASGFLPCDQGLRVEVMGFEPTASTLRT
jgi:hypothetical protein